MDIWKGRALSHSARAEMLDHLTLKANAASGKQLAERFGMTLGQVHYHLCVLRDAGFVLRVKSSQKRGGTQHFYMAAVKAAAQ